MNRAQAKEILLLYRPGTQDAEDPQIVEAMELARQDPDLRKWFQQHQAFQVSMRAKFAQIDVPEHLKRTLLSGRKIVRPPVFWNRPVWLASAAVFILLLSLAIFWVKPPIPNRFANYRENMVSFALRMYGMDLETNDSSQLRQFLGGKGAPADYQLTQGLAKLQLKGGGPLRWRGNPVSMVCFDRGGGKMLFLFVMKRAALKDPPSPMAQLVTVDDLMTASWTRGDDTYVLAGPEEPRFEQKYVPQ